LFFVRIPEIIALRLLHTITNPYAGNLSPVQGIQQFVGTWNVVLPAAGRRRGRAAINDARTIKYTVTIGCGHAFKEGRLVGIITVSPVKVLYKD
jgi:hypothetical protein